MERGNTDLRAIRKNARAALLLATTFLLQLLIFHSVAEADLVFCNKTLKSVVLSFGYYQDNKWLSTGWWHMDPGQCQDVVASELYEQIHYYYAYGEGQVWEADSNEPYGWFCVNFTQAFDEVDAELNCNSLGLDQRHFILLDTGDSHDAELDLTMPDEAPFIGGGTKSVGRIDPRQPPPYTGR
jgi:uncharacterized membrane protein